MDYSVTKEMIKTSLDARWRKRHIYLMLGICIFISIILIISIIVAIAGSDLPKKNKMEIIFGYIGFGELTLMLLFGGVLIYYVYRYFRLFKNIEKYEIYEVKLDKPNTSYNYRNSVYYTVSFMTNSGRRVTMDTNPVFSTFSSYSSLDEYNNKIVKVAYNEETYTLVVLGFENTVL